MVRVVTRLVTAALVLGGVYVTVTFFQVWRASLQDDRGPAGALVVLGAAQYDGRPSPVFAARLDHAADLYESGTAPVVVVTGGAQPGDRYTEASAGATYLRRRGVPDESLRLEVQGGNSWESIAATARFLRDEGIQDVVLVSSPYHSYRIADIARELRLSAAVSPIRAQPAGVADRMRALGRETVAVAVGRIVGYRRLTALDRYLHPAAGTGHPGSAAPVDDRASEQDVRLAPRSTPTGKAEHCATGSRDAGGDDPMSAPADVRWDLDDLYTGPHDPALERDLTEPLAAASGFADRFRGRIATLDAAGLVAACAELERLWLPLRRAGAYAALRFATDTADEARAALVTRVEEQTTALSTATLFFDLEWVAVDDERARAVLTDEAGATYRHHLEALRRYRPHVLSEPEELIVSELSQTGTSAWQRLFTQLVGTIRVEFDGATRTLDEVLAVLYDADRDRRRAAQSAVTAALEDDLPTRAFAFNTLLADKAIHDRLRGHPHWLHRRNLANEADDAQVDALIEAVTGRYDVVARYYRLKGRMLGLDPLYDYDRYAPIVAAPQPTIDWEDARVTVLDAYREFSPEMADLAADFFTHGWIDAPPAAGKRGGAFAHPVTPDVHPYIMVNFTGRPRDVMTLAHELGHGIHMRLAQRQTLFNADTPLTTAETASIFGETVTLGKLMAAENQPAGRLALVAQRLDDAFAAIFRQVAMNRFEDAVHNARRGSGELSTATISEAWMSTQRQMFADSVTLTDGYRLWWSYVPHFVDVPGYVYAYAYGYLLAFALYRTYEEQGPEVVPRYLEMLAAGGSMSPNALAARAGVDLTDPNFWARGLAVLDDEVAEAERLAAELV